ncbi:hypothetical protein DIPPA_24317 [Diplonema papillatum]|nr:hypothetical protein DIPPA_24317 [Diplonema papillatum]
MPARGAKPRGGMAELRSMVWKPEHKSAQDWDVVRIENVSAKTTLDELRGFVYPLAPVEQITFQDYSADTKTAVCLCYSEKDALSIVDALDDTDHKYHRWAAGYQSRDGIVRKTHRPLLLAASPFNGADDDFSTRTTLWDPKPRAELPRCASIPSSASRSSSQESLRSGISVAHEHLAQDAIWGSIALKTVAVLNVPGSATPVALHTFFHQFGPVCSFNFDRVDGMARIGFEELADAEKAAKNRSLFEGRKLVIKRLAKHLQNLEKARNKEDYRRTALMGTPCLDQVRDALRKKRRKQRRNALDRAAVCNAKQPRSRAPGDAGDSSDTSDSLGFGDISIPFVQREARRAPNKLPPCLVGWVCSRCNADNYPDTEACWNRPCKGTSPGA